MKYLITDTGIIRISERAGVIQNTSSCDPVEISDSQSFTDSYILYSLNERSFNKQLYLRAYGKLSQPLLINVVTFINSGGSGSVSSTTTDTATIDTVDDYIDNIFSGGDDNYNDPDTSNYIDNIFNGGDDGYTDNDFEGYIDDIYGG